MPSITEGKLDFIFPAEWKVELYDKSEFYTKCFQGLAHSKCVDIVAFSPEADSLWLIEAKDYRIHPRSKKMDLFDELAAKVRDTLASLYVAQRRSEFIIHEFAKHAAEKPKLRVAFHLEQPRPDDSETHPPLVDRAHATRKLRSVVKAVDPNPWFCEINNMPPGCPWQVIPNYPT